MSSQPSHPSHVHHLQHSVVPFVKSEVQIAVRHRASAGAAAMPVWRAISKTGGAARRARRS